MIDRIKKDFQAAIDAQVFPGCAAGIFCRGESYIIAMGRLSYEENSAEVTEDTVYDVASITKAIPVSALALKLINDGQLSVNDQLIRYVPQYSGSYREKILIKHLLTHTLSFDFRLSDCKDLGCARIMEKILTAELQGEPGRSFSYANATSILLGMVLESCTDRSLDLAASEYFFDPLGMTSTTFDTSRLSGCSVAPSEIDPWRGRLIQGEVHDESAWALRPAVVGSAGLFSTAPDLLVFIRMLLEDGTSKGVRFFEPRVISLMHTDQIPEADEWTGMGWELNQKSFMGNYCSNAAFGKTGFTGCSVVIDPLKKAGFVLLSNHIFPRRRGNRDCINRVRSDFADRVLGKL